MGFVEGEVAVFNLMGRVCWGWISEFSFLKMFSGFAGTELLGPAFLGLLGQNCGVQLSGSIKFTGLGLLGRRLARLVHPIPQGFSSLLLALYKKGLHIFKKLVGGELG